MRTSVGRPRWMSPSTPSTACWSSDARATSAPPDPRRGRGQCARTPDPCTTLAVEVLEEEQVVPEVRVVLQLRVAVERRPPAVRPAQEEAGQPARQLLRDLLQGHEVAGAGRALDLEVVAV